MKSTRSPIIASGMFTRRSLLQKLFVFCASGISTSATAEQAFPLKGDDGAALDNFRLPSELDPAQLPGIVWRGAKTSDIILYEFFDYNCSYCRHAAQGLDQLMGQDTGVRLGLVNNPILSIGSVQVAKIQQAILRLHGPDRVYEFHMKMLSRRGQATGPAALDVTRSMRLDPGKIEESANSATVADVLSRQAHLAGNAGMVMTPSFVLAGNVILGWPGGGALHDMVDATRKCDHPVCN